MNATIHKPVMPTEVMHWLDPRPNGIYVDGTLGGGGHTRLMADAVGDEGRVIAVDRDPSAVERAERALKGLPVSVAHASYADVPEVLAEINIPEVDGILLDLGLSSDQLEDDERGFSFHSDGPLDLRFDPTVGKSAAQLLQRITPERLADVLFQYGEERFSRRIARAICERQRKQAITLASDLADIVRRSIPVAARSKGRKSGGTNIDPATRTFQALRIAVNEELRILEIALRRLPDCLRIGGRIAIISFHSLEDRLTKIAFRDDPRLQVLTRKPLVAADLEVAANPRARSAKFRVAERISAAT